MTQPSSNPCQNLLSGGLYDSYEVCMAAVQQSQQQSQQCLDSFNNSTAGQIVNFLSTLNLITDFGNYWLDWSLTATAKPAALQLLTYLSNEFGSTEFLSVTGASAGTVIAGEGAVLAAAIAAAAAPLSAGIPFATAVDAGVRQMCSQVPGLTFSPQ